MGHWDCGGYGGSKSFASADNEESKYIEDLKKAKEILAQEFSDLEILLGYSKVEGENLSFEILN